MKSLGTLKLLTEDCKALQKICRSQWLSPGKNVEAFQNAFSKVHGCNYGVMTNSGTDALKIAVEALKERYGWQDGDVILCPSITFVATINVIIQCGLVPKLVDVSMYDFNLNPDNMEFLLQTQPSTKNVKAVMVVHLAGKPCNMNRIMAIADKYDLRVIEDSCEAMGVDVGHYGDISCFSFYAAHLLVTGVGGMACTNDKTLRYLLWSYANHGRREPKKFEFDRIGYSCRPTEFEAALGLNQLKRLPGFIEKRRTVARYLHNHLEPFRDLWTSYSPDSACMFFPIVIREESKVKRSRLLLHLEKNNIEFRLLMPLTNQPCYKGRFNEDDHCIAKWVNEKGFYIGSHQDMTPRDLQAIVRAFKTFFARHT